MSGIVESSSSLSSAAPSSTLQATLQSKVASVLSTRTNDAELQSALKHVSTLMVGETTSTTTSTSTRSADLRGQLEARDVQLNRQLLALFGAVQSELERVEAQVADMRSTCGQLDARLQHTKKVSGALIAQTDALAKQRARTLAQRQMATQFLARFQLSDEELAALKASELREPFFAALARVRRIHADCKLLLRTQHQRAGLEIMDAMAMHQEAAYRRLYRWVKSECTAALSDDAPELNQLLPLALDALRERIVLHGYALEDIGKTRGAALGHAFTAALTVGGPGGVPRPIEMHAHDPLRYAGDMLGWLHQAVASEFEFVSNLLLRQARKSSDAGAATAASGGGEGDSSGSARQAPPPLSEAVRGDLVRVLNAACEMVVVPFKTRCEQLLSTNLSSTVTFRLVHLFDFYARTVATLLSDDAVLVRAFRDLKALAATRFDTALRAAGDRLLRQPPPCTSQLTPAYEVQRMTAQLTELMTTFDGSLVPADQRVAEFAPVLDAVVSPIVRACAAGGASLSPAERQTYAANCADVLANALAPFAFAAPHRDALRRAAEEHVAAMLHAALVAMLVSSQLADAATPHALESNADALDAAERLGTAAAARCQGDALARAVDQLVAAWTGERNRVAAPGAPSPTVSISAVALVADAARRRDALNALRQRLLRFYTALHAAAGDTLRFSVADISKLFGE